MNPVNLKKRFEGLYESESDALFRYCFFRVSDRESALELTQEIFMRFWDSLREGKDIKNDRAFIYMIARNIVIDFYRKKKSSSLDAILDDLEDSTLYIEDKSDGQNSELTAEARFVMDKLKELPPEHRKIIHMRYVDGMKPKEISEILGVTPNVVSVRILRAVEKLKEVTGYSYNEDE